MLTSEPVHAFSEPPDPGQAHTLDELIQLLRLLKSWAGLSLSEIVTRMNADRPANDPVKRSTVNDCFTPPRTWLDEKLVVGIVKALHPDAGYASQWRQALRIVRGEATAASYVPVRDRLPDDVTGFVGRAEELDQLMNLGGLDTAVVAVVDGLTGNGKTWLAIHAGHQLLRQRRYDVVLFVNLRGFHPDRTAQPPAAPASTLEEFLRRLGMPGQQVPHGIPQLTRVYRTYLQGKRSLIVLDNAADASQVLPLLPDTRNSFTLITSRCALPDLPDAARVPLDVFTPCESVELLRNAAGDARYAADPDAALRIAKVHGYHPHNLSLTAGRIKASEWSLKDHLGTLIEPVEPRPHDAAAATVDEVLEDRVRRAHQLRLEDPVRHDVGLSYEALSNGARRALRRLVLHPGDDVDVYATAALTADDLVTTQRHFDELVRANLLHQRIPGRYEQHDLVCRFTLQRARDEERTCEREQAVGRLLDHYLATAITAMAIRHPDETNRRPQIPELASPAPPIADVETALAWLDSERHNLVAVCAYAAAHGWYSHATRLATTLYRYLDAGGPSRAALEIHARARQAANRSGDRAAEAQALADLGGVYLQQGRHDQAAEHYELALPIFQATGDRAGEARVRGNLGHVSFRQGRFTHAAECHAQARGIYREIGDEAGELRAASNQANVRVFLGEYTLAIETNQDLLTLYRTTGYRFGQAVALNNLGFAYLREGQHEVAESHLNSALAIFRELEDRQGEAHALTNLATTYLRRSRHGEALAHHEQALDIFREIGDRDGEADALNGLGETLNATGQHDAAASQHTTALDLALDNGSRYEQARAHDGLADALTGPADVASADEHRRQAYELYREFGTPDADRVRTKLDPTSSQEGSSHADLP